MKQLTINNLALKIDAGGSRWLTFRTENGSAVALNIDAEFNGDRIVHEVIRQWSKEQSFID